MRAAGESAFWVLNEAQRKLMKGCTHEARGKSELIKNEWGEKERREKREFTYTEECVELPNKQRNMYACICRVYEHIFGFVCILGLHK